MSRTLLARAACPHARHTVVRLLLPFLLPGQNLVAPHSQHARTRPAIKGVRSYRDAGARQSLNVETILSGPATAENKQLLWRAWTALSEDTSAARYSLLEKILHFYMTDDSKDAFRTLSMLDSKIVLTQLQPRVVAYYRCWAHAVLGELDHAYAAFLQTAPKDRRQLKDRLMELAVETGDWRTGIALWHSVSKSQTRSSTNGWSDRPTHLLGALFDLIPNVSTFQFIDVLPAEDRPAFRRIARRELVIHLARRGNHEAAAAILAATIADHEPIAAVEVGATMSAMLGTGDAAQAIAARDLYHSAAACITFETPDLRALAIKAYAACGDLEGARRQYDIARSAVYRKAHTLLEPATSMMAAYAAVGDAEQVHSIYQDCLSLKLRPDIRVLGLLMQTQYDQGDLDGAIQQYEVSRKHGVQPDRPFLSLAVRIHADALHLDGLRDIVRDAAAASIRLPLRRCSNIIGAFAARHVEDPCIDALSATVSQEKQVELTRSVVRHCLATSRHQALDITLYSLRDDLSSTNTILHGMICRGDPISEIRSFVTDARSRGFKTSPTTVALLAHAAAMHGEADLGGRLLDMSRSFDRSVAEKSLTALVLGYVIRGLTTEAEDLASEMYRGQQTGVTSQVAIDLALDKPGCAVDLLRALLRDWSFDGARSTADLDVRLGPASVVAKCEDDRGRVDVRVLTSVMRLYAASGDSEAVLRIMKHTMAAHPDEKYLMGPLGVALESLAEGARLEALWTAYREGGFVIDSYNEVEYIRRLVSLDERAAAQTAVNDAIARGLTLPQDLVDSLSPPSAASGLSQQHETSSSEEPEHHYVAARA